MRRRWEFLLLQETSLQQLDFRWVRICGEYSRIVTVDGFLNWYILWLRAKELWLRAKGLI